MMGKSNSNRQKMVVLPIASIGFTLLMGCGQETPKQKIEAKLRMGRHAASAYPTADRFSSLSLTSDSGKSNDLLGSIIDAKTNPSSQEIQWIDFNTSTQAPIQEKDLISHTLSLTDSLNGFLHVSQNDLNPLAQEINLSENLKSISFTRIYEGTIPVRDAYLEAVYWKTSDGLYALRQVNNNTHGVISVMGRSAPAVSLESLQNQLPFEQPSLIESRQVVYAELIKPGIYQFVMATELTLGSSEKDRIYTITAENGTSRVLEAYTNKLHATKPVMAKVFKRNYKEPAPTPKPIPDLELTVAGQKIATNIDSQVDLASGTSASVLLMGSRFTIVKNTDTVPLSVTAMIDNSSPEYSLLETDAAGRAALNAYTSLIEINRFALQFMAKEKTPFLTYNLPVFINVPSEACNAFFLSTAQAPLGFMALGEANAQCGDMAQVNDVPHHEWGHGFDNAVGMTTTPGTGITDGAFSEGIGDIISAFFNDTPQMAVGFFLANNNPIRNADNNSKYPNLTNQVHTDGLIIAGAFWDMRKGLITTHGKTKGSFIAGNLFFNHLLNTNSYLQSYQNVLLLDDNDGNPTTRSPNYCVINAAFAKHGLATAESCTDQPDPSKLDGSLVIATQKQEPTGVTLMAATTLTEAESMIACVGTRDQCNKDQALPRSTLMPEGLIGDKIAFSTTTPISVKAQDIITLFVKNKGGEIIGSRMFKYASK